MQKIMMKERYMKEIDKLEKNMYENIDDENTSIYDEMLNRED
jgi:hypothetical protein